MASSYLSLPLFLSSSNRLLPNLRSSSSPPFPSSAALSRRRSTLPLLRQNHQKAISIRRLHATSEETIASVEKSQEIVGSSNDDGVSTIISVLLIVAFIGLSILTIGVIYIGVTDFLQKREKEKFEKEEEAGKKKKKSGKKNKVKSRGGPRGFGQKAGEDEDEDEED